MWWISVFVGLVASHRWHIKPCISNRVNLVYPEDSQVAHVKLLIGVVNGMLWRQMEVDIFLVVLSQVNGPLKLVVLGNGLLQSMVPLLSKLSPFLQSLSCASFSQPMFQQVKKNYISVQIMSQMLCHSSFWCLIEPYRSQHSSFTSHHFRDRSKWDMTYGSQCTEVVSHSQTLSLATWD